MCDRLAVSEYSTPTPPSACDNERDNRSQPPTVTKFSLTGHRPAPQPPSPCSSSITLAPATAPPNLLAPMHKLLLPLLLAFTATSCAQQLPPADEIIQTAIQAHYGDYWQDANVTFDFRDHNYSIRIQDGQFGYVRTKGQTVDIVTNEEFTRMEGPRKVDLSDKLAGRYRRSVNSVRYFFMLPAGLDDPAVNAKTLGERIIEDSTYYEVEVRFNAENGGEDHDDVFHYYFNKTSGLLGYLSYSYATDGGGVRFRAAYNRRTVGGLIVQDYVNYSAPKDTPLAELPDWYAASRLKELSRIENKNITVK